MTQRHDLLRRLIADPRSSDQERGLAKRELSTSVEQDLPEDSSKKKPWYIPPIDPQLEQTLAHMAAIDRAYFLRVAGLD